LPYTWTRIGIASLNNREGRPAIFYLHPWEIDPDQPRIQAGLMSKFRHYRNLDKTELRLRRLLREFDFGRVSDVLEFCNGRAKAMTTSTVTVGNSVGSSV
jgi:hypothetical protein